MSPPNVTPKAPATTGRRTDPNRRTGQDPLGRLRAGSDLVGNVRRSIVGVRTASTAGTGWIALGNGLVLTSHEAVGYSTEVAVELQGGRRVPSRVIWVDVMRDLALVLPIESLGLPPLFARPDLPKAGEIAYAFSNVPGQSFRVATVLVGAVDVKVGSLRCFEIDAVVASSGGPLVDLDGRVIGLAGLDLPRGACRGTAPSAVHVGEGVGFSPALPITALQRALTAFDLAPEQFDGRLPMYRCPGCTEPYTLAYERCLTCGQRLPHAWSVDRVGPALLDAGHGDRAHDGLPATPPAFATASHLVRELLGKLGIVAPSARVGARTWRIAAPGPANAPSQASELTLEIDDAARTLRARIPLVRLPAVNHEGFYRFLLALNEQTSGGQRFFVEGELVWLGFAEPIGLLAGGAGAELVESLIRSAPECRKTLGDAFDTKAAL